MPPRGRPPRRRLLLLLLLVPLLLSAPAAHAQVHGVDRHFTLRPGGRVMYVALDTVDTPTIYPGTPFRIHRALVEIYQQLEIPLSIRDSAKGQVGHTGLPLKRIEDKRMSTYVGCGAGMTGQYADIHKVTIAVVSWVYPQGKDSSGVRTGVFAGAVDVAEGSSSMPRLCHTTGRLEERIRVLLQEKLR